MSISACLAEDQCLPYLRRLRVRSAQGVRSNKLQRAHVVEQSRPMSLSSLTTKEQPRPTVSPSPSHGDQSNRTGVRQRVSRMTRKVTTRHGWFGDYDYAWLCTPTLPFSLRGKTQRSKLPPFYQLDADLPLFLAITSGLQHALAMLAGLITPPIIFASALNLDASTSAYMISASLIGCGARSFE